MGSLYGLLATQEAMKKVPIAVAIWCVLILVLGFAIGFKKGFRRVAWGGFYWLFASIGFFLVHKLLATKNPLALVLKGKLAGAASFSWSAILLIACIAISLVVYGWFSLMFRPKEVELGPEEEVDQYGFVYEDDMEEDGNIKKLPTMAIKHGGKPKFFGRVAGGFMCMVNVAAVLVSCIAVALIIISQTSLSENSIGAIFEVAAVKTCLEYSLSYAFDFFTIGVIMLMAYKGFNTGFIGSLRAIIFIVVWFTIDEFALLLPFTNPNLPFVSTLIERCATLYTKFKPEYCLVFAKLTAGLIMATAGTILVIIINVLLKKLGEKIEENRTTRILDEVIAVVIYLVVGAVIVTVVWSAFYLTDYCGIIKISEGFNEKACLSKEFFELAEHYLKDFADKYLLKYRA